MKNNLVKIFKNDILKPLAFSAMVFYVISKPTLDYFVGKDSLLSRAISPLQVEAITTQFDGQYEKEWQFLLERNRKSIHPNAEYVANIIRFLPS